MLLSEEKVINGPLRAKFGGVHMSAAENEALCGSSAYERKYYFNEMFGSLPQEVKDELKIMCVMFTEEVGGEFLLAFDGEGTLLMESSADEGDLLYDEIGSALKIKQLQITKAALFEQLEQYYYCKRQT